MATGTRVYEIFEGPEIAASSSLVLLGSGAAGTLGASRRLVHPDAANFPLLVYSQNPDRTSNLDNFVLPAPLVSVAMTLSSTRVTRFERLTEDVIVTELWTADGRKASMTAAQFRLLYEYVLNPPDLDVIDPEYIQWEPRDRNDFVYEVEMLSIEVGSGGEVDVFDVREYRSLGGAFNGGLYQAALDALDTVASGLLDREVKLRMRVVAVVA